MKKDTPDPGSLLEWKNKELLRKLHRCHCAISVAIRALEYYGDEKLYELILTLRDALTDQGGTTPDE